MKTLKLRIKDKHAQQLNKLAGSVNFVWNYVNELSFKHLQRTGKFFSAYDVAAYTKGSGELLNLHSQTLQAITETHAKSRKQFKKTKLNHLLWCHALSVVVFVLVFIPPRQKSRILLCGRSVRCV